MAQEAPDYRQNNWLNQIQQITARLRVFTPICILIMLISLGLFTTSLLMPLGEHPVAYYTKPALLIFTWAMTCYLFIITFNASKLTKPTKGLLKRLHYWVKSLYIRLILLLFMGMTVAVCVLTIRLLNLSFG